MAVVNRKERWATEGIRFQRLNPDGTKPRPSRFVGFSGTADISKIMSSGKNQISMKIDHGDLITKTVAFPGTVNLSAVTVAEAITALNGAQFPGLTFIKDPYTGRIMGSNSNNIVIGVILTFINNDTVAMSIPSGSYSLDVSGFPFTTTVPSTVSLAPGASASFTFSTPTGGILVSEIKVPNFGTITPALPPGVSISTVTPSILLDTPEKVIQFTGPLAAALDFGQGIKHNGNGLQMIGFFNDQTMSIGLPKDVKDKEEIDIEGAKGTITRMIIGAMLQGLSPVVTLKEKDYDLLELIQGGKLDRETGTYEPPLSNESDQPVFFAEIFSPLYSAGISKTADVAGYERILLRSMVGIEGDVPIEAKAWATYAFNLTATEYVDEDGVHWPAWQEQTLTREQFEAFKLKLVS